MKYIDADKLIAEIKRLIDLKESRVANKRLNELLSFTTSLQQEQTEVDLEKEIEEYTNSCEGALEGQQGQVWEFDWEDITLVIDEAARHFYDLGLNARKEE